MQGVAQPLSDRRTARSPPRWDPLLAARGLLLVGLDVIGDCLTEINVTSRVFPGKQPNRFRNVAKMFVDALERAAA